MFFSSYFSVLIGISNAIGLCCYVVTSAENTVSYNVKCAAYRNDIMKEMKISKIIFSKRKKGQFCRRTLEKIGLYIYIYVYLQPKNSLGFFIK
jgi:hypothetical protein